MTHNTIAFHKYDWLCHLATFYNSLCVKKGGQVTKPIILVKICYNIVCHSRSYKYLIKYNFLASADIKSFGCACLFAMLLLIGPALCTPQVFLFNISLLYRSIYVCRCSLKLSFEKFKPTTFLKLSVQNDTSISVDCVTESLFNYLPGVQVIGKINLQCNNLSQTHSNVFFRLKTV